MRLGRLFASLLCGLCPAVWSAAESPAEPAAYELVEVSGSVAMALHDNGSNMACVATGEGLVFFDASLSTRTAQRFREDMESRFERPTAALVLTHAHLDHILGMGAFDDVPVYAASAGRPRWEHFTTVEWDERAMKGYGSIFPTLPDEIGDARLRMPTDWFEDELELGSGDDQLLVRRTGGHTADSSSVVVAGVVIAGDLVQARRRPYFGEPDTDFNAWIDAMKAWEEAGVKAVCPGHGPVIDVDELGAVRAWFEETAAAMARQKQEGAAIEEIFAGGELPAGYWPEDEPMPKWWGFSLKRLYDSL